MFSKMICHVGSDSIQLPCPKSFFQLRLKLPKSHKSLTMIDIMREKNHSSFDKRVNDASDPSNDPTTLFVLFICPDDPEL